ncbi:AAA family ATPase [Epidermidibacterium keratini]|uniref:AAA family ATPase n=1 Tax=Epidermidibacterium keratini TaxID=1891644 RepID=A0A7L4YNX9_9ACTN|nr:UvrD-helicase domain-containing protein [Epidermidibacterium keratini]QHC00732.1 AAA family ATPase [Epidermidibacterium keratini]
MTSEHTEYADVPQDAEAIEIAREQEHVDKVNARVEVLLKNADAITQEGLARGRSGSFGGLVERDAFVHVAARRKHLLNREHEGLVFGRLDFDDQSKQHVGRIGVLDENYVPMVIDWRAPAAAPFYRATAADRQGVVRRRVIRSRLDKVISVEDDLLDPDASLDGMNVIGDGALIASLTRARTGQMRDIVATIQQHQDEAIRAPSDGVTVISGGPGTGKTVVALHRAAYLLYRDRKKYESSGILVVGPSPTFMRYIERVLPSLGEDSAALRSIGEIVDGYSATRVDSPELAAVKGSTRIAPVVSRAARFAGPGAPEELRLFYRGEVLTASRSQLRAIRRSVLRGNRKYNRSSRAARDALTDLLYSSAPDSIKAERTLAEFRDDLNQRNEFTDFLAAWWPMREPHEVLASLGNAGHLQSASSGVLTRAEVADLARDWASHTAADGSMELSLQDIALIDEIRDVLGEIPPPPPVRDEFDLSSVQELTTAADREYAAAGPRVRPDNYTGYGHVIVDEAQDLSPMQWRMLGRRGRVASWTVVGDIAQTSWGDPAETRSAMNESLAKTPRRDFHLSTNYRSPAEVFSLAADVVRTVMPDADVPDAVRSTGHEPEHVVTDDVATETVAALRRTLSEVEGTVAVIAPSARVGEVRSWVGTIGGDRVQVVDELSAKGLEYDGVVVVEPDEIAGGTDRGTRLLYVVLTRATQRLVTVGRTSDWLPSRRSER